MGQLTNCCQDWREGGARYRQGHQWQKSRHGYCGLGEQQNDGFESGVEGGEAAISRWKLSRLNARDRLVCY